MSFKIQAEVSIKTFYALMFNGFYQEVKHLTVKFDHLSEGSHEKGCHWWLGQVYWQPEREA